MAKTSEKKEWDEPIASHRDENFAFIAGYTEGGAPYGITWEEQERIESRAAMRRSAAPIPQKNPVALNDIVQEMEMISDEMIVYFKRSTGEFILVTGEGEPFDDQPESEPQAITAEVLENDNDYVSLPSRYDIHEHSIMERFCRTVEDAKISNDLFRAISGKGAFRRFKDAIFLHCIEAAWYRFKEESYKEIAKDWCEEHGIAHDGEKKEEITGQCQPVISTLNSDVSG